MKNGNKVLIKDRLLESNGRSETITAESMREVVSRALISRPICSMFSWLLRLKGVWTRLCVCFDVIDPKSFCEKTNSIAKEVKTDKNNNQANRDQAITNQNQSNHNTNL